MSDKSKPLLLVDIDGVLNFFGPKRHAKQYTTVISGYRIQSDTRFPVWLSHLERQFDIHWATMWQEAAPKEFAPNFGWGAHIPYIDFDAHFASYRGRIGLSVGNYKLPAIQEMAAGRPLIWIDDDGGTKEVRNWVNERNNTVPTKVIVPDPMIGMTLTHLEDIKSFADTVSKLYLAAS